MNVCKDIRVNVCKVIVMDVCRDVRVLGWMCVGELDGQRCKVDVWGCRVDLRRVGYGCRGNVCKGAG